MADTRQQRFFVTIIGKGRSALLTLAKYNLDLINSTTKTTKQKEFAIDALLTLEQVGKLVEYGYTVLVKEESSKLARARPQMVEFEDWIKAMKSFKPGIKQMKSSKTEIKKMRN